MTHGQTERKRALVVDLGTIAYAEALEMQRRLAALRCEGAVPDLFLLCQHPPVLTIGRGGDPAHLCEPQPRAIPVFEVERGGDVTYHGPGQLVGYPILSLEGPERDLHRYLRNLEQVVLDTLAAFGIAGERLPGFTGVWLGNNKLCAIGVAVRHWVTLHGFALNVTTDLRPFDGIVPCGLHDRGVASMERVLGTTVSFAAVQAEIVRHFGSVFSRDLHPARMQEIPGWGPANAETPRAMAKGGRAADGNDGDLRASGGNGQRQPQ